MPVPSRRDPYGQFNFLVEIDGTAAAGFSECAGLSTETDVIEYREGSGPDTVRKIPGLNRYTRITLKRGITTDKSLWQWRKNVQDGIPDRRNGSIVLLNEARQEVARWNFSNGWPSRWDGPSLNAKSSELAIEALEIVHEGLEWA